MDSLKFYFTPTPLIAVLILTLILVTQAYGIEKKIESTIVTAQKQKENMQDVPLSITLFNDYELEDKKITSLSELAGYVPNFILPATIMPGSFRASMRGISATAQSMRVSTGLFVDGIPLLTAAGFDNTIIDIERIEVLRGPQGTIYGKGTEAGAINIISKLPEGDFTAKFSADTAAILSSEGDGKLKYSTAVSINTPVLKDKISMGISGKFYHRDGFVKNITKDTANDNENWYGKLLLRVQPNEKTNFLFVSSQLNHNDGGPQMNIGKENAKKFGLPHPGKRKVYSDLEGFNDSRNIMNAFKTDFKVNENLQITNITSIRTFYDDSMADWDFTPKETPWHLHTDNRYRLLANELRFNYLTPEQKWLLGIYTDKLDNEVKAFNKLMFINKSEFEGYTYALFFNRSIKLTEKFNFSCGLRYEKEDQDFHDKLSNANENDSWMGITPKVSLEYKVQPHIMNYFSITKGYRSGGFNAAARTPEHYKYKQEELWSYELGAKGRLLNKKLFVNAALFYMTIDDMQVNESISESQFITTNAAEATGKGGEIELRAKLSDTLSFSAGAGFTNLEFEKFKDISGNYKGKQNPFAPEYTFNFGLQYRNHNGLFGRIDILGSDKIYFDKNNKYSRNAYELVNFKLGYEKEKFDIYLYGKNIFDKEYNINGFNNGKYTIYSDPGEIGLSLSLRF